MLPCAVVMIGSDSLSQLKQPGVCRIADSTLFNEADRGSTSDLGSREIGLAQSKID
jgi:hypothetical protein